MARKPIVPNIIPDAVDPAILPSAANHPKVDQTPAFEDTVPFFVGKEESGNVPVMLANREVAPIEMESIQVQASVTVSGQTETTINQHRVPGVQIKWMPQEQVVVVTPKKPNFKPVVIPMTNIRFGVLA